MKMIGQTKAIDINTNTEVRGTFTVMEKINLNRESQPCVEDPNFSFTTCVKKYVAEKAGCHLDFVEKLENISPCRSLEQLNR